MAERFSDAASMSAALAAVLGQPVSASSQPVANPRTDHADPTAAGIHATAHVGSRDPFANRRGHQRSGPIHKHCSSHPACTRRQSYRGATRTLRWALVIDKPVEIVGTGRVEDTIIECADATTITVATETALLRNLTVRNWAGLNNSDFNALAILQGHVQVEGCHITADSLACVAISRTAQATLRTCRIHGGKQQGSSS